MLTDKIVFSPFRGVRAKTTLVAVPRGYRLIGPCLFLAALCPGCLIRIDGFPFRLVEGTVLNESTGEPFIGGSVLVIAISGGDELGRALRAGISQGEFDVAIPVPGETPFPDQIEVRVTRESCETVFVLDARSEVTVVDLPFPRGSVLRITDPILVLACESDGEEGAGG